MEKEINYNIDDINLNCFGPEALSTRLESLLKEVLAIISKKSAKLMHEEFKSIEVNLSFWNMDL